MKKIDIHAHTTMWGNNVPTFKTPMITPEPLKKRYEEIDIEKFDTNEKFKAYLIDEKNTQNGCEQQ